MVRPFGPFERAGDGLREWRAGRRPAPRRRPERSLAYPLPRSLARRSRVNSRQASPTARPQAPCRRQPRRSAGRRTSAATGRLLDQSTLSAVREARLDSHVAHDRIGRDGGAQCAVIGRRACSCGGGGRQGRVDRVRLRAARPVSRAPCGRRPARSGAATASRRSAAARRSSARAPRCAGAGDAGNRAARPPGWRRATGRQPAASTRCRVWPAPGLRAGARAPRGVCWRAGERPGRGCGRLSERLVGLGRELRSRAPYNRATADRRASATAGAGRRAEALEARRRARPSGAHIGRPAAPVVLDTRGAARREAGGAHAEPSPRGRGEQLSRCAAAAPRFDRDRVSIGPQHRSPIGGPTPLPSDRGRRRASVNGRPWTGTPDRRLPGADDPGACADLGLGRRPALALQAREREPGRRSASRPGPVDRALRAREAQRRRGRGATRRRRPGARPRRARRRSAEPVGASWRCHHGAARVRHRDGAELGLRSRGARPAPAVRSAAARRRTKFTVSETVAPASASGTARRPRLGHTAVSASVAIAPPWTTSRHRRPLGPERHDQDGSVVLQALEPEDRGADGERRGRDELAR